MNEFYKRTLSIIRSRTGRSLDECRKAFNKTYDIKLAIEYLNRNVGQII